MSERLGWAIALAMFSLSTRAGAAPVGDGGGRDVSVAMFSTHSLHAVTVTPLGKQTWVARCAQCAHEPLTAPLHVTKAIEIFAGGMLRISDDVSGDARTAAGLWHLRARDGGIDVVLMLPSERYVTAVLRAEAAPNEPAQSLRALAILARTYALNGSHYTAQPGHLAAELCDSTECEAMLPGTASQAIEGAVRATAGETIWFGGHRAEVFFSQSCGGLTEDVGTLWPALRGTPYLRSHVDPYCVRHNTAAWHTEVPLAKLMEIARAEGWHVPANIAAVRVMERSESHRALRIGFAGDNATVAVSASALRFGIGRALGWDRVRSDAYELAVRNGALVFDGRGHGHGVGLCQDGAAEMAAEGKSAREILAFYFPGTAVRVASGDEGWHEVRSGALTLRATQLLTAARADAVQKAWAEAQRRFPPGRPITAEIDFVPSTEMFRQMTTQPGWALASTRGSTIVLQPEAILRGQGRDDSATLLHEMLHVLVESESSDRAPLWLREGLVEMLAGDGGRDISESTMSVNKIDDALANADSLRSSERAHLAAATRVRMFVARYGLSVVRGWLSSGVPAGVE